MDNISKRGVILTEVLIAVIVLSVGIAATLGALRHIVAVTKAARQYLDAMLVTDDIFFTIITSPHTCVSERGSAREYKNEYMLWAKHITYSCVWEAVEFLDNTDAGEDEDTPVIQGERVSPYKKVFLNVYHNDDLLINMVTFHAFEEQQS